MAGWFRVALSAPINAPAFIHLRSIWLITSLFPLIIGSTWLLKKGNRRWLKVVLTDPNNIVVCRLDSFECAPTAQIINNYNKTFQHLQPGIYKVYLNYTEAQMVLPV